MKLNLTGSEPLARLSSKLGVLGFLGSLIVPSAFAVEPSDPIISTSGLTLKILFIPSATAVGTTATFGASTVAATEKKALAAVALEDAAHFYGSGELTGVLPTVLRQLRKESPELAELKDSELVDSVVLAAEQFITIKQAEKSEGK